MPAETRRALRWEGVTSPLPRARSSWWQRLWARAPAPRPEAAAPEPAAPATRPAQPPATVAPGWVLRALPELQNLPKVPPALLAPLAPDEEPAPMPLPALDLPAPRGELDVGRAPHPPRP